MTDPATFVSALLVGLVGAPHCLGMCGGIAGSLAVAGPQTTVNQRISQSLAYSCGRITSYTVAGGLAGLIGQRFAALLPAVTAMRVGLLLSALFALMLALYLLGRGGPLLLLERAGAVFWRRIQPLGRRFLPVRSRPAAFALGLVWGWLPCGLVYTVLAWSLVSGSPVSGMWLMLGFGIGTLPALVGVGVAVSGVPEWRRNPAFRYAAACFLLGFALYSAWLGLGGGGH